MTKKFDTELAEYLYSEMEADDEIGSSSDGVGWAGMYLAENCGKVHIVEESPDGTVVTFTYPIGESALRWEETTERLDMDREEPAEGDYVIQEQARPGVAYTVSQYGKAWEFLDWTAVEQFIRTHMEAEGFYPNVWHVSDHGNYTKWEMEQPA